MKRLSKKIKYKIFYKSLLNLLPEENHKRLFLLTTSCEKINTVNYYSTDQSSCVLAPANSPF